MRQILQDLRRGETTVLDVPQPLCGPGQVLIASRYSLISGGTEKSLVEFGQANLISKARSRPDKVQQVLGKLKTDGLLPTVEAVFSRLEEPLPLGYCNAGVVIEAGAGVREFSPGDRVISNGPHAEVVCVPKNLCAKIPADVSDQEGAFTVLGAIALQGVRLAEPLLGERVVVLGLGLIGLLTVQLLRANGCQVLGADFDPHKLTLAEEFGAQVINLAAGEDPVQAGLNFSEGNGIDKVLITAATDSSDPVHQAALMSRKRGKIVLVGVTGLDLKREDFYEKELSFQVSCSYGPGRYDPAYEEGGHDYPFGFVRWTEKRNFQAILDLMGDKKLDVSPLIDQEIPLEEGPSAYQKLLDDPSLLGILLEYPVDQDFQSSQLLKQEIFVSEKKPDTSRPVIGMIGAGNFSSRILIPALKKLKVHLHTIASAGGTSAAVTGRKFGFAQGTTDYQTILDNPEINTVFIATRHNLHADLVVKSLQSGKNVFVEKPLALNRDQLLRVKKARREFPDRQLMVGFNRRFSPLAEKMGALLSNRTQPVTMIYTVNAGSLPPDHWTQDPEQGGGRIIGEACHMIDLLRFLVGKRIVRVEAQMIGGGQGIRIREDKMTLTLKFEDGSLGTVHYFANGSNIFPKERVEVFSEGRILCLDNFRVLKGYQWPGFKSKRLSRQDKGHQDELKAFVDRITGGGEALIPWETLEEVTLASFLAVEHSRMNRLDQLALDE